MIYVPVTQPVPPSPQAVELAGRLTHLVREFQEAHPQLSSQEVAQALHLTARATAGGEVAAVRTRRAVALVAGGLVALAALGVAALGRGFPSEQGLPVPLVAVAVSVLGLAAVMWLVATMRRGPR